MGPTLRPDLRAGGRGGVLAVRRPDARDGVAGRDDLAAIGPPCRRPAEGRPGIGQAGGMTAPANVEHVDRADRLVPWIAGERMFRAVVLVAVGLVLVTHVHADWASAIRRLGRSAGLDPTRGFLLRL